MRTFYGYFPLIATSFCGLLILIFIQPITKWVRDHRAVSIGYPMGRILHVEGSVRRIHGEDIELIPINLDLPPDLRGGDKLQTSYGSKADVVVRDRARFTVPEFSGVQFSLWDEKDETSPVYVRVLFGDVLRGASDASVRDVFIVKNGVMYPAVLPPQGETLGLKVHVDDFKQLNDPPAEGLPAAGGPSPSKADPETLSNEYVNSVFNVFGEDFRKCWRAFARGADLKGVVKWDFEISALGKMAELKLSGAGDDGLRECLGKVADRVAFRPYSGKVQSVSFPLEFE